MTSFTFADPSVRTQARLVQRLANDLHRVRIGLGPSDLELANAPFINNWRVIQRAEPALVGLISGHPVVHGHGITSGLYVLDRELGFARTFSRFYRLGQEARAS